MSPLATNLEVVVSDTVITVRINRPEKHNALSRAVLTELGEAFAGHAGNEALRVAVLTAAGDKSFAAGGDLKEFAALRRRAEAEALFALANRALDAVRRFPVPVVAALNGTAVGGGAELALACDFRVAAAHASIGFVHGKLAISSGFGGGTDLMRLLDPRLALLHMLQAQVLDAQQARTLGLLDEVAGPGETLEACVARFVAPITQRPSQVVRAMKAQALAARMGRSRAECERTELEGFVRTWTHPDHWAAADKLLTRSDTARERG